MKKLCVVHANCQGEPLLEYIQLSPQFTKQYEVVHYINYTRQPVPNEVLSKASLFLYQHLSPAWNELSSEHLLKLLPKNAHAICIPNLYFNIYWPFHSKKTDLIYSDLFLNDMVQRGLKKAEAIHLYLRTDITKFYDLDALVEWSLEHELAKEKMWDIKMTEFVAQRYKREHLFHTYNHPGSTLLSHIAHHVLTLLDLPPIDPHALAEHPEPLADFDLPIHPRVAEHFGLQFSVKDRLWNIYGRTGTLEEYVNHYVDCRMINESDFISFVQLRMAQKRGETIS